MAGPLAGVKVIEMAGIGPAPFCAMLLADMGAEIVRIERQERADLGIPGRQPKFEVLHRGRKSVAVDVKSAAGRDVVLRLVKGADALIEGFRPGVMERLGLGPAECLKANPRLVFGRMTGFGQEGPLAPRAGHDINYIALAGVLHAIGTKDEPPVPPLNLVGDFGGGGMFLAFGVLAALLEARSSGKGQVVDAAMIDGAAYLMGLMHGLYSMGTWADERQSNILDGAAPWYGTYRTKDDKYVAIGSIEKRFYEDLLQRLGLDGENLPKQHDRKGWPDLKRRFTEVFQSKTRAEWEKIFEGSDACFAPVLSIAEAPRHPHNALRANFIERDGVLQPAPAPRFSRTVPEPGSRPVEAGANTEEVLRNWGFDAAEVAKLAATGVVGCKG